MEHMTCVCLEATVMSISHHIGRWLGENAEYQGRGDGHG